MKKFIVFLILVMLTASALCASAFDIQWGNRKTYQNHPSNTLRLWAESVDSQSGSGANFYVDSGVAVGGDSSGSSWTNAITTIDGAIGLCTADKGDTVYVNMTHKETEGTAATSLFTLDVAGVSIVALHNGSYEATVAAGVITLNQRPTLVIDKADATITVSAKNCRVSGFLIVSDIDNVAVVFTVAATADGFVLDNCVFRDNADDLDYLVALSIAAGADNVQIVGNRFITTIAAGGNNAILLAGANENLEIIGNISYGKYATGNLLGSAAAQVNATIVGNMFINAEADAALTLHTSSTGILANNYLGGLTTIASTLVGDDAMWCFENYVTGDLAKSGTLNPDVDSE